MAYCRGKRSESAAAHGRANSCPVSPEEEEDDEAHVVVLRVLEESNEVLAGDDASLRARTARSASCTSDTMVGEKNRVESG